MMSLSTRARNIPFFIYCFITASLNAATVVPGDEYVPDGKTYSTPVDKVVYDFIDNVLFIGAREAGGGIFALSGLHPTNERVQPLAPALVALNNEKDQDNPIFDQGITQLDLMETTDGKRHPIMVLENDPTRMHLVRDFFNFKSMTVFSTEPLKDAYLAETSGIVGLAGFRGGLNSAAIAAVKPNYGEFGDPFSGFALITFDQMNERIEQPEPCEDGAATNNENAPTVRTVFKLKQDSTTPFDRSSDVVKIGDDLESIDNDVVISWNRALQRGYVGIQVVGGYADTDGARSVMITDTVLVKIVNGGEVIGSFGKIVLRPFAPASAFDSAGDQIIGGIGSNIELSVHAINHMETSTGLMYAIIHGGNGSFDTTKRTVYALPIINARNRNGDIVDVSIHGTLASKNSEVFTMYDGFDPSRFIRRRFITPATTPVDTPRATDSAVQVGGGPIEYGDIQSVSVVRDGVMVSVAPSEYEQTKGGMYISRPLFDETGKITAWTAWARIGGSVEPVFHAELSRDEGNITFFTGENSLSVDTIKRTSWGIGSQDGLAGFAHVINGMYTDNNGGVQGLVDVPVGTPGLNDISLLITTGLGRVTLTETGAVNYDYGNELCPHTSGYTDHSVTFEDGTITQDPYGTVRMLTIEGGALDTIGPIVTSAVATSGINGYLFVGGSCGLAVLSKQNGDGWDTSMGLGPNFAGLEQGMAFKIIGDYRFVRKLVVDGDYLYVVTTTRVDRLDLSTKAFTPTTIASSQSLVFDSNDAILDGAFSGKLGLLATSKGLFRTSNDNDVSMITQDANRFWTCVNVLSGVVPPQRFFICSSTNRETDFAKDTGGIVHLLSAYFGENRARVNRFVVKNVHTMPIDDTTIQPLPDGDLECVISSFLTFSGFRTLYVTDGAIALNTVGKTLFVSPYAKTRNFRNGMPISLEEGCGTLIEQVLRSSASGSWLVAGDFGIRINE